MLSLSKKFFNQTDYLSEGYKIAFNPTKNKLTFYKAEKADKNITDLQQITKHVNELKKPIFTEITPYRNCHKKIKAVNQSIDVEKGTVINLESFNENFKPTSAELKEQIWAVHATNILPKDTLTPVIGNYLTQEIIPGISNTIHFSLGELVRPHSNISWEDRSFAVITPLNSIIDQTVNIFAYDTFITGNWKLKKETIILIPEGTDISEIQDKAFSFVSYKSSEKTLRTAINEIIQERKGLNFRMTENSVLLGSRALLDESININTPSFFENLLKEKQGLLSFGDHTHSQIGDASLLGLIRQLSTSLIHVTSDPGLKIFHKPLIYVNYHLVKSFYDKIKDKYFTKQEQESIEELLITQEKELPKYINEPLWPFLAPEYFQGMNHLELLEFKTIYSNLFEDNYQHEFKALWAISRWFTVGYNQGLKEKLQETINEEINLFIKEKPQNFYFLFTCTVVDLLSKHNKKNSDRLEIVKTILSLEAFERYKDVLTSESEEEEQIQQAILNLRAAQ